MVLYDYKCESCGNEFELELPMGSHPTAPCPKCGGQAERHFSPSGIVLAGSGFYNTDQRGGSSATSATSGK